MNCIKINNFHSSKAPLRDCIGNHTGEDSHTYSQQRAHTQNIHKSYKSGERGRQRERETETERRKNTQWEKGTKPLVQKRTWVSKTIWKVFNFTGHQMQTKTSVLHGYIPPPPPDWIKQLQMPRISEDLSSQNAPTIIVWTSTTTLEKCFALKLNTHIPHHLAFYSWRYTQQKHLQQSTEACAKILKSSTTLNSPKIETTQMCSVINCGAFTQ